MKKRVILIVLIILVIVVISLFLISSYKIFSEAKKSNIIGYNLLKCMSNCPSELNERNELWFNEECGNNCSNNYNNLNLSGDLLKKYEKYYKKLLINSEDHVSCINIYTKERDAEKYKGCLKEILPKLKEEYDIE